MATVEEKGVKDVVEQIIALKRTILTEGKGGQARLNEVSPDDRFKDILTGDGQFNLDAWGQIPNDKKSDRFTELLQIRDALTAISSREGQPQIKSAPVPSPNGLSEPSGDVPPSIPQLDGPNDPQHVMYAAYASTKAVYGCISFGGILVVALLYSITLLWDKALNVEYADRINTASAVITLLEEDNKDSDEAANDAAEKQRAKEHAQQTASIAAINAVKAIKENKGAHESTVLQMIILLGALGGSLHLLGSLVNYVGERKLRRSWLPYYFSLPLVGAALAPIVYMLLRVGILTPTGQGDGGSAIANLNLISIYAFAALTGMFAKIATEKLGDIFTAMFQPRPGRTTGDKISADKPSAALEGAKP